MRVVVVVIRNKIEKNLNCKKNVIISTTNVHTLRSGDKQELEQGIKHCECKKCGHRGEYGDTHDDDKQFLFRGF